MDISRKTDYAVRMLAELANRPACVLSVREVAEENGIPYSFARVIQHELTRSGIVGSVRGARGGMKLAVDPAKVTLLEIIETVQGPLGAAGFSEEDGRPLNQMWAGMTAIMRSYFASVTLKDVVIDGMVPESDISFGLVPAKR